MPFKISDEWLFNKLETISTNVTSLNEKVDHLEEKIESFEKVRTQAVADNGECLVIPKKSLIKIGGVVGGGGTALILLIEIGIELLKAYVGG